MPHTLDFALKTHPGLVRPHNEDAIAADPAAGLFILADGLGGYNAGEIASTMSVSTLLQQLSADLRESVARTGANSAAFDAQRVLSERLVAMNSAVYRAAMTSSAYEGMATTIVVAWLLGGRLWIAHAGDSRLYRYRKGAFEQITRDHSFSQELLDAGMVTEEEARQLPAKNLVTRAIGASPELEPEIHDYDTADDDLLLLCSDGLTEMVTHADIAAAVSANTQSIHELARRLVTMANEAGGRDNISVVIIKLRDGAKPAETAAEETAPSAVDNSAAVI